MGKALFFVLLGICATIIISGVAIIPAATGAQLAVGIGLVGVGLVSLMITIVYRETSSISRSLRGVVGDLGASVEKYASSIKEVADRYGLLNDARFIADGFIGLQRECIALERGSPSDQRGMRMAMLGHLPSHLRLNPLSLERGMQLYKSWEPPHMVKEYVALVNHRRDALFAFVQSGGICRETYEQAKIEHYINEGYTFHDKISDPTEEVEDRLRALLSLLQYENYYLSFIPTKVERTGPFYLLKQGVGLVLDFRTTELERHFTRTIDGLVTTSTRVMEDFGRKFELTSVSMERQTAKTIIEGYIARLAATRESTRKA